MNQREKNSIAFSHFNKQISYMSFDLFAIMLWLKLNILHMTNKMSSP